ncbi:Heat shock factor protein 4 [Dictyocoela muelleri]|nr:Heat shock factor protein 4 [Dictyocoela muelleri]
MNMAIYNEDQPKFIQKLLFILNDTANNKIISWNDDGTTIIIKNQIHLEQFILPRYFRSSNINSFIRQLNKYNFRKVENIQKNKERNGFKKNVVNREHSEFYNPNFRRDRRGSIEIKPNLIRKKTSQDIDMRSAIKLITKFFHIITDEIDQMKNMLQTFKRKESEFNVYLFSKNKKIANFISEITDIEQINIKTFNSFRRIAKNLNFSKKSLLFIAEDNGTVFNLLKLIKKRNIKIPVVVLSHSVDKSLFVKYLNDGVDEIVLKPYDKKIIVDLIFKYKLSK